MGTCEWDDAASWLLSTIGGGGGVQQRTPPPRDTLTDDQRERIRLRREEALARRRRTGGDAAAPAPSTAPGAGFACAATTETASPLAARVPRAPSPPSPVRSLHDDAFDPPPQPAPPPAAAAPENLERKRAFAAALAAAMAQTPGDGDGDDPIPAGGATRPDWLVSPTDAAGAPRPVTAYQTHPRHRGSRHLRPRLPPRHTRSTDEAPEVHRTVLATQSVLNGLRDRVQARLLLQHVRRGL